MLALRNLRLNRVRFIVTLVGLVFSVVVPAVRLSLFLGFTRATVDILEQSAADRWILTMGVILRPSSGTVLVAGTVLSDTLRPPAVATSLEVAQSELARVAVGQRVWVTADACGDRRFEGTVVRVGSILGRQHISTEEPTEKVDTKVLETLI